MICSAISKQLVNWEIYFWNIFQWLDNIQQRVWPLRGCLFPDRKLPRTDQQVITTRPLAESLQSIDFVSGNVFAFGIEAKVAVPLFFWKTGTLKKTASKNIYPKCEINKSYFRLIPTNSNLLSYQCFFCCCWIPQTPVEQFSIRRHKKFL